MSEVLTAQALQALPNAPLWRRLAAILYDTLLLAAVLIFATALLMLLALLLLGDANGLKGTVWMFLWLLLCAFAFYAGFWLHGGQTLGMRAWRLRVVDLQGCPLTPQLAMLRFLAAIPSVGLLVGLLWSLIDAQRLCPHDRFSMTRLVLLPKEKKG